ncbi:MAG TPA: glycerophosphodiester phosphodiesterase [Planctomycetes bacterium]|nr:glycerophosphodiester phosphodiesterase [Fuerstiella sp.]HIK95746.1 glycerophosphodiester phosphodiesterase [Planctomycetota bacterium]
MDPTGVAVVNPFACWYAAAAAVVRVPVAILLSLLVATLPDAAVAQSTRPERSPLVQSLSPERQRRLQTISQTISDEVPLVIAHRGASGYLPEHTTEAAALAHALGADFIEQDVVLSQDGVAVVFHDVTLEEITNVADVFPDRGQNGSYYVFDFTLAELRQLSVFERFPSTENSDGNGRFPQNTGRFRLATLDEHLQLIQGLNVSRGRNVGVYVEIKQPQLHREQNLDSSREVLRVLGKYGYRNAHDRVFVQCFDESELHRLRTELKCRLPLIQLLSDEPSDERLARIAKVADGIGISIAAVIGGAADDPARPRVTNVVKAAHQHAMLVHAWTLRTDSLPDYAADPATMFNWLVREAGVDGIFTDQPDILLSWRQIARAQGRVEGPFKLLGNGASVSE